MRASIAPQPEAVSPAGRNYLFHGILITGISNVIPERDSFNILPTPVGATGTGTAELRSSPRSEEWTVTTGHEPNPRHTFIHLTINRTEQDQDFIDSIQQFVEDWKAGLETHW